MFHYDALGRQTSQVDRDGGGQVIYSCSAAIDHPRYDAAGRVKSERVTQRNGSDTLVSDVVSVFNPGAVPGQAADTVTTTSWRINAQGTTSQGTTTATNSYA